MKTISIVYKFWLIIINQSQVILLYFNSTCAPGSLAIALAPAAAPASEGAMSVIFLSVSCGYAVYFPGGPAGLLRSIIVNTCPCCACGDPLCLIIINLIIL